jgi:hypothetical protein
VVVVNDKRERNIRLEDITLDPRLQMRARMNQETIADYAENLDSLPPAKLILDEDGHFWLTDGWHTFEAHKLAGRKTMPCFVTEGTYLDALIDAAGANHAHGLRRTNEDKRKAAESLVAENEVNVHGWTQREIAGMAKVSQQLVNKIVQERHRTHAPAVDENAITEISSTKTLTTVVKTDPKPPENKHSAEGSDVGAFDQTAAAPPGPNSTQSSSPPWVANQPGVCRSCRISGSPRPGCNDCKAARQKLEADSSPPVKPPGNDPKSPKTGKVVFDNRTIDEALGKLVRAIYERAKVFGETELFKKGRHHLSEFNAVWQELQKEGQA